MAFFNDLGKKLQETSQGVVQKTKDTAEVLKLNGMISDEEKRIDTLFTQIGKMYFEHYADAGIPALANLVAEIRDAQNKIKEYDKQVKRLKGFVRCPNCGGDVACGTPFCSSCGTKMPMPVETGVRCANCGMPIQNGCAFCTHCGTKVEAKPPVQAAPAAGGVCPNCGTVSNGMPFCVQCGTKIKTADEPQVSQPAMRSCPSCGKPVANGMAFCTNCGTKIDE